MYRSECTGEAQEERTGLEEGARGDHLVQGGPFHQLKRRGVNAYLLHVDRFIQLLLVPDFDLNQPPPPKKVTKVQSFYPLPLMVSLCHWWRRECSIKTASYLLRGHGVRQRRGRGLLQGGGGGGREEKVSRWEPMLISVGGLSVIILWKTCQILHACIGSPPPVALAERRPRCRAGAVTLDSTADG